MTVHYQKQNHIGVFTLDNGDLNVLTPSMHKQLYDHLAEFLADPDVRVGILTGRAGGSFCAGDDIKNPLPGRSRQEELEGYLFLHHNERDGSPPHRPGWDVDIMKLERYKPIIGAVDQYCLGQGMIYLLHLTDIRIASTRAQFGLPEVAYGMGGGGGLTRLGRQIPHVVAMKFLLTGEFMSADCALQYHLINEVVDQAELLARAMALATKIASQPPIAVRVEMESYYQSLDLPQAENLRYSMNLYRLQRLGYEGFGAGSGFLRGAVTGDKTVDGTDGQ